MAPPRSRGTVLAAVVGAAVLLLLVLPAAISLASGDGDVCFADAACPLSAVNPCMRRPSFAIVGRCAVRIR